MAALELLPTELLQDIAFHLDIADLAHLLCCSKSLCFTIEATLYKGDDALDKAMRWACKHGQTQVIRRAFDYGAPISTVKSWSSRTKDYQTMWDMATASTLDLAAKGHHYDAFKLLLELGADLGPVTRAQPGIFLKRLYTPSRHEFLRLLLNSGLGQQARRAPTGGSYAAGNGLSLVFAINSHMPLDLVRLMITNGADPNLVQWRSPDFSLASPLSAAIDRNAHPYVDLLLQEGADINGKDVARVSDEVTHIPIFVAARLMARTGCTDRLQMCLSRGADINRRCPVTYSAHRYEPRYFYTTPILVFLDSIESWEGERYSRTVQALDFMLGRGALLEFPETDEESAQQQHYIVPQWGVGENPSTCGRTPSAIELLTDRWGLGHLANEHFFHLVSRLGQLGVSGRRHTRIATEWSQNAASTQDESHKRLVDLVIKPERSPDEEAEMKDLILHCYVTDTGLSEQDFGDKERSTIWKLMNEGADINARFGSMHHTALGFLTKAYIEHERGWWAPYISLPHRPTISRGLKKRRAAYVHFLEENGAVR